LNFERRESKTGQPGTAGNYRPTPPATGRKYVSWFNNKSTDRSNLSGVVFTSLHLLSSSFDASNGNRALPVLSLSIYFISTLQIISDAIHNIVLLFLDAATGGSAPPERVDCFSLCAARL